ncbi:helix-turn-helix transcriptional regulator [Amycolatopsis sp. CA-161197]|uniref:helix-turn-helix transcriptional regulator n=1 Tax=Amycolatopsis sp. CA-161197 TaxID=3239922 RepID=UPI003D8CC6E4
MNEVTSVSSLSAGEFIRGCRLERGLTMTALGSRCGMRRERVSALERDARPLHAMRDVVGMAAALRVSPFLLALLTAGVARDAEVRAAVGGAYVRPSYSVSIGPMPRTFGDEMYAARKFRGVTLAFLVGRTRVSAAELSRVERGASAPSIRVVTDVAGALDMPCRGLVMAAVRDQLRREQGCLPAPLAGRPRVLVRPALQQARASVPMPDLAELSGEFDAAVTCWI